MCHRRGNVRECLCRCVVVSSEECRGRSNAKECLWRSVVEGVTWSVFGGVS